MDIFVLIAVMVGLVLLALLVERFIPQRRKVSPARRITIIAVCSAVAAVLMLLEVPMVFMAPGFYKLDFSELPVLLCGFFLGPVAAVLCEVVKIALNLLMDGTTTAFVGEFANFTVGCSFVLPAVIVYHIRKTRKGAFWGLLLGTAVLAGFGSALNAFYLIPAFSRLYGIELKAIVAMGEAIYPQVDTVWKLALYCVVPLNLLKGTAVSILTLLLYKRVARPLFGK